MTDKTKLQKGKNQHIQVFVRVRPLNSSEKLSKSTSILECTGSRVVEVMERPNDKHSKTFSFDRVFDPSSKQMDVYKTVLNPLIDEVLAGYNCTVFAYGQTGTGKTYTMEGERTNDPAIPWDADPLSGLIPRSLSHLFDELRRLQAEFTVRVSYLELYNEELIDLLSTSNDPSKIKLYEDPLKKGSVIVSGLEEVTVHTKNEIYNIMEKGSMKRQTASTLMNAQSSRSHTVFSITVHIKENSIDGEELLKTGKLNLVDLAGSENIGRSGAENKRAREAGNINQSLLTLGRVITSLVERTPHIPYRESKLTRLLQESLGGRTKTSIIATVSPAVINLEETLSTLEYAHRARNITNRPEINQKLSKKTLIKEYTEEIERLRQDLVSAREKSGVYLSIENYNKMIAQMEQSEKEMSQKLSTIKLLNEQMEEKELICQQLNMKLERRTQRLQETHQTLCVTKRERDETAHLLERHMQTEEVLGDQARTLLSVAEESSKDTYQLHDKLSRKRSVESENEDIIVNFHRNMNHDLSLLEGSLQQFTQVYHKYKSGLESNLGDHLEDGVAHLIGLSNEMSTLVESHNKIMQQLKKGSSERVHDSKRMIQDQLASLRQTCDLESNKLHTFHVDSASPGIQNILYFLELQKTVTVALNQLSDNQLSLMMKLMEDHVSQVKQIVSSVKENHRALVASVKKREEDAHKFREAVKDKDKRDTADLNSALTQQIAMLTQLMSNIKAKSDDVAQMAKQAEEEDSGTGQTIEMLSNAIITDLDRSVLNEPDVVERFSQERMEVFTGIEEAVERSSTYMSEAGRYLNDLKNEMVSTLTSGESAWRKHYTHTEQDLRTHLERLGSGLQDELELTAQLADVVSVCANNNEAALERRRHTLTTFVRERQDDIVAECSYVSDWTRRTVAEVQQRAQELDRFLTEDLRKDLPTGQTPKRKEFHYPHQLVATSPHDRILERFRARSEAMMGDTQPMLDLSLEESSSSSSTSDYLDDILSVASTSRVEQEKLQAKAGPRKAASTNDVNFTGSSLELNRSTVSEPELGKSINKENEEMPTQGMKNKGKVVVKSVPRKIPDETAPRNVLAPKNY